MRLAVIEHQHFHFNQMLIPRNLHFDRRQWRSRWQFDVFWVQWFSVSFALLLVFGDGLQQIVGQKLFLLSVLYINRFSQLTRSYFAESTGLEACAMIAERLGFLKFTLQTNTKCKHKHEFKI